MSSRVHSAAARMATAGITINVRREGNGPPLLFLGGSSFDLSIHAAVFDSSLAEHFTVAAADPRGLGQTDAPAGSWTMHDYASDALDLINALGWQQVRVVGESFGAMVGLELALLAPERITHMVLAAGAPGGEGGSSFPLQILPSIEHPRERAVQALTIQDSRFADLLITDPSNAESRIAERMEADQQFLFAAGNLEGYKRLLKTRATHDCWNRLHMIQSDTLIIAGEYDNQAPLSCSKAMAAVIKNSVLRVFHSGHSVCFATGAPVAAMLEHWQLK